MSDMTIYLPIAIEILRWAEDHSKNPNTEEIRVNFASGRIELYDYEDGIVQSHRTLPWFKI